MTTSEVSTILQAITRLDEKVEGLRRDDDTATKRIDAHSTRLDKLERIAYVALGMALAAGAPQVAAIFR